MTYEPTMKDLEQRAVRCKHWRWLPGMLSGDCRVTASVLEERDRVESEGVGGSGFSRGGWCLPDLTDAATLGCLLHVVREAWADPALTATRWPHGWIVAGEVASGGGTRVVVPECRTEAEALVVALEAAP